MSTAKYHRIPSSPSSIQLSKTRKSSSTESITTTSSITLLSPNDQDTSERGYSRNHHLQPPPPPTHPPDSRFNQPKPSPYARLSLLLFLLISFYFAFTLRSSIFYSILSQQDQKIHAESEKWAEWAEAQDSY